jgi:hypothetical protein
VKAASRVLTDFAGYMDFAERRSATEMLWYGCLVPREMIDPDDLREFLSVNWKYSDSTRTSSQFLKLCCYHDMLVYRWPGLSSGREPASCMSPMSND